MPQPQKLLKAELRAITWDEEQQVQETGRVFPVQFNPESLKLAFSNQNAGGDQRGGAALQFVGRGTTKLAFDLWFDVTAPDPDGRDESDVRRLTQDVVMFIQPTATAEEDKFIPPGVRFLWGTFLFDGVVESISETLEFFSEDGRPLRAGLSISLMRQEIQFQFGKQQAPGLGSNATPGTAPLERARSGDSLPSLLGRSGRQESWQAVALANNIDDPRQLPVGLGIDARMAIRRGR
ncbi:MAG TPA: hypothetical protein VES39_11965 [Rhodospirillales bacterium]|nr:hypothetical protein [Rhodospirillales bacterium]